MKRSKRRGVALLLVLGILAVTMATAYAMIRAEFLTGRLSRNARRNSIADSAARTGLMFGLREMSNSSWTGIGSTYTSNLVDGGRFDVTFVAGDSLLSPLDIQYSEYPYRVTIRATGYATDPTDAAQQSVVIRERVVQLVRKRINQAGGLPTQTVYQWTDHDFDLDLPVRMEGNAALLGEVSLAPDYPTGTSNLRDYLDALASAALNGGPDYRPFSSGVTLSSKTDPQNQSFFTDNLLLTISTSNAYNVNPTPFPTITSYQLFPGGAVYTPPDVSNLTLSSGQTKPNVVTNPLGISALSGQALVTGSATYEGVLYATSGARIDIAGSNNSIQGTILPSVQGDSNVYSLPAIICDDRVRLTPDNSVTVTGATLVNDLQILASTSSGGVTWTGKVVAGRMSIGPRTDWPTSSATWNAYWDEFTSTSAGATTKSGGSTTTTKSTGTTTKSVSPKSTTSSTSPGTSGTTPNSTNNFALWLCEIYGLDPNPKIRFQPLPAGQVTLMPNWSQPIYLPATADSGLRWSPVR